MAASSSASPAFIAGLARGRSGRAGGEERTGRGPRAGVTCVEGGRGRRRGAAARGGGVSLARRRPRAWLALLCGYAAPPAASWVGLITGRVGIYRMSGNNDDNEWEMGILRARCYKHFHDGFLQDTSEATAKAPPRLSSSCSVRCHARSSLVVSCSWTQSLWRFPSDARHEATRTRITRRPGGASATRYKYISNRVRRVAANAASVCGAAGSRAAQPLARYLSFHAQRAPHHRPACGSHVAAATARRWCTQQDQSQRQPDARPPWGATEHST